MNNLVLIGMPGSGKTTISKELARRLSVACIDTDRVIEAEMGMPLSRILDVYGDDGFREIENRINASISPRRAVIAPGGSVIYGREAMEHYRRIARVIYLEIDCDALLQRLGDLHSRGVTIRPGQTFQDLYDERCPLYRQWADMVVETADRSPFEIVREILRRLR